MRKAVLASGAAISAALLALFLGLTIATAADAPVSNAVWAQARSDIPPDPAVRFGVLPNGMRYAIMRNALPTGMVSVRFRIGAGSFEETDAQQGLAHFLEHMSFRGSTHVPDGDVQKTLERLGLRMGADTNAATGQTQTTFRFDLPKNDEATLDTGLMLMREIGSELTLDQGAMDKERGVVLSEERLGDVPARHAQDDQSNFLLKGQLAPTRMPIGKVAVIQNAPVSQLRAFYDAYYRPERAALVIAGDIDPDLVEAKISAHFADWHNVNPPGADPDLGTPAKRDLETDLFSEPGARSGVQVSWITPYDAPPQTKAKEKEDVIRGVGLAIINQRLGRAAAAADPPFANAGVFYGNNSRSAKIATLSVTFAEDRWQRALLEADSIRRQVIEQGVRQDEVDQQIKAMLTGMQAGVARASTRQTPGLANAILADIDRDEVFTSPERDLETATADLNGLTADEVSAALRGVFVGSGPLIFASSPKPIAGGGEALRQAFLDAEKSVVAASKAPRETKWSYTKFGPRGRVAEQKTIEDIGVTFVRFANGVRLTVKPTKFRADEILVSVRVGAGMLSYPKNRPTVERGADGDLVSGGLKDLEFVDMRRLLSSRIYGVNFDTGDDGFVLSGGTRPIDLDLQMQVLAAYLTAPGWRPEAFQRTQNAWLMQLERADITPSDVFSAHVPELLRSGDARWAYPKLEDIQSARPQDLKTLLTPALARGPVEVVMVGDLTVEQAIQAVSVTFGALPERRSVKTVADEGELRFPDPTPTPLVLTHGGRADQGLAFIAWPNTDIVSDMQDVANRVLMEIMRMRMTDALRVNAGATYSPSAGSQTSLTFPGFGYLDAFAEIPPDKTPLFFETIARVSADLADKGPTEDELQRVLVPAIATAERNLQTNGFWSGNLAGAQFDDRHLALIRTSVSGLESVTAASVQRLAQKYLVDEKAWKLVIVPKPPEAAAASAAGNDPGARAN